MATMSLEQAQTLVRQAGVKIQVRPVTRNEYRWKCPNRHCPKSRLENAIRGTVYNWVVLLAAQHLQGEQRKEAKRKAQKEREQLLVGS